jgi:hypothetical protein
LLTAGDVGADTTRISAASRATEPVIVSTKTWPCGAARSSQRGDEGAGDGPDCVLDGGLDGVDGRQKVMSDMAGM